MTICIYGGTFDPPHIGHMHVCESFIKHFDVDKFYVIPTSTPPHKIRSSTVSGEDRLEMCKRCFPHISSNIEVSDVELKRQGKSYTADTIRHFKDLGNDEIYLLCGTDMILTLDRWYNFKYIFTNVKIVYIRRENDSETAELLEFKTKEYKEKYGAEIHFIDVCAIELSSSEIREKINASGANGLLPDDVISYIKDKDLYRKE